MAAKLSVGCPVISAMRSKSLSRCRTVRPASSAVAATMRTGADGARCRPWALGGGAQVETGFGRVADLKAGDGGDSDQAPVYALGPDGDVRGHAEPGQRGGSTSPSVTPRRL